MIWRWAAIGGAVAAAGLAVALWWVERDRGALKADLATAGASLASAQAALSQAEEAARVHRAYLDQAEKERAGFDKLRNELIKMEGADAPLSDYLRDAAGRLWP